MRLAAGRRLVQAQLAWRSLGSEPSSQFASLPGAALESQLPKRLGRRKIERRAQLLGGVAQQATLQGGRQRGQADDVHGQGVSRAGAGGTSAASDGLAGE